MVDVKSANTDELRYRNYLAQLHQRGDMEVRELQSAHGEEVQHLLETEKAQMDDLHRDFDVRISQEAEKLDEHLQNIRMQNEERVGEQKRAADQELNQVRATSQQRIDEYKKNADAQLDSLRKQYLAASEAMHERYRKSAHKEKEVNGA